MEIQNKVRKGTIVNCLWAYVYEHPDIYSNVISAFRLLEIVDIFDDITADHSFYSVIIKNGNIGYCLKDYIVLIDDSTIGESNNG